MKNRQTVLNKLDLLETLFFQLEQAVKRGEKVSTFEQGCERGRDIVEDIKAFVEDQEVFGQELNRIQ
jgi:hypothetical protein|tara:strand:+ start:155 stop:355 length:201 start_codon:yes stop_codon:yes gene_type:complete